MQTNESLTSSTPGGIEAAPSQEQLTSCSPSSATASNEQGLESMTQIPTSDLLAAPQSPSTSSELTTESPNNNPSLLPVKPIILMSDLELTEFQDRVRKNRLSVQTLREHHGGAVQQIATAPTKTKKHIAEQTNLDEYV